MPQQPQRVPQIGEDVTALMPPVGADVSALMDQPAPKPAAPRPGVLRASAIGPVGSRTQLAARQLPKDASLVPPAKAWPYIGAGIGALATAPASIPALGAAAIGAALGGFGGAGVQHIQEQAETGRPESAGDVFADMGKQGLAQGALELAGGVSAPVLRMAGKGLYRAALRPAEGLRKKFGDLVSEGLSRNIPVMKPGAAAVERATNAAYGKTGQLATDAGAAGATVPRSGVIRGLSPVVTDLRATEAATGDAAAIPELASRIRTIMARNPQEIAPTVALDRLRAANNAADAAYRAERASGVVSPGARINEGFADSWRGAFQGAVPGSAESMAETKTLHGLGRAMDTAVNRPHQLTNLMALGTGVLGGALTPAGGAREKAGAGVGEAVLMRALASPSIESGLGIAFNRGAGVPMAQLVRAAIIAGLTGSSPRTSPEEPPR